MWERNLGQNFWGPYPWGLISESFHEWYEKGQSTGDWCINTIYGIRASSIIIMALQRSYKTTQFKWCLTSSDLFYSYKTCFKRCTLWQFTFTICGEKGRGEPKQYYCQKIKGIHEIKFCISFFSIQKARYLELISCLCFWRIFSVCFHNHVEGICKKTLLEKIGYYISSKKRILFSSCSWMCWTYES